MNVSKNAVYNAANLAMFMVNLSSALLQQNSSGLFGSSINDLKAWFRAKKYVLNTLKLSEQNAFEDKFFFKKTLSSNIFLDESTIHQVSSLGRVNPSVCQT